MRSFMVKTFVTTVGVCLLGFSAIADETSGIEQNKQDQSTAQPVSHQCCINYRGNADFDPIDLITLSDHIMIVNYVFKGGPEPTCMVEADVNASGGPVPVDVSDVTYLTNYMFKGGPRPKNCW